MNKPRYNRCDSCGRNTHKVAVRVGREVLGVCPSCWTSRSRSLNDTSVEQRTDPANVIYDRRASKPPVEQYITIDAGYTWVPKASHAGVTDTVEIHTQPVGATVRFVGREWVVVEKRPGEWVEVTPVVGFARMKLAWKERVGVDRVAS